MILCNSPEPLFLFYDNNILQLLARTLAIFCLSVSLLALFINKKGRSDKHEKIKLIYTYIIILCQTAKILV